MRYKVTVSLNHLPTGQKLKMEEIVRRAFAEAGLDNCVDGVLVSELKG